jgi:hypothetical protein
LAQEVQSINSAREQARKQLNLPAFDYTAPAELFPSRSKKGRGQVTYKRFDSAAEALRFAIEELGAQALLGAHLEVDEARFGAEEIRHLYDSPFYPLVRQTAS